MLNKEQLKQLLVNEYLNRFLTFYISKTNSINESEELSQKAACECLEAIDRVDSIENVNAYFWSVAHNTYKSYLNQKNNYILDDDYCRMQIVDASYNLQDDEKEELHNNIRRALSILSGLYRKVLVYYYYHEMKIKDIGDKLGLSNDMVKFYLSNGKKKLKEIFNMNQNYGERSFNPKEFSIYYSGIDFSNVNIWDLFKRKLPGQIALICFETPKTISDISIETGCGSCYIEEEVELLVDAGVMKEVVKGKYQTNFHIIRKNELNIIDDMFYKMYKDYAKEVEKVFEENYDKIKATKLFNYEATIDQYKWIFADAVADIDRRNMSTSDNDYPKILSCGARAVIFGIEGQASLGGAGQTPTYLDKYVLWARDLWKLTEDSANQRILKDRENAQTVIDVYNGIVDESKEEIYAFLIQQGIISKKGKYLYSNVAYKNKDFRNLMATINNGLWGKLEKSTEEIKKYIEKIVTKYIPNNLKDYVHGYVMTWMQFFAGNKIIEVLLESGFLNNKGSKQISYFTD